MSLEIWPEFRRNRLNELSTIFINGWASVENAEKPHRAPEILPIVKPYR